jgi:chemotaxis signal transduction protein
VIGAYVRLRAAGEDYALPVGEVLEVIPLGAVEAVPGAPAGALGVSALRGQPLPVFDLAQLLGLQAGSAPAQVVVTQHQEGRIGWAVDSVLDVGELPAERSDAEAAWLQSSALVDGVLVGIVDLPAIVAGLEAEAGR